MLPKNIGPRTDQNITTIEEGLFDCSRVKAITWAR